MRTKRKTIDQIIFNLNDLRRMRLEITGRIDYTDLFILSLGTQHYICEKINEKEYAVLYSYEIKPK